MNLNKIIQEEIQNINEDLIEKSSIPNTMSFYHGGNLDRYDDNLTQKRGRFEYGAGLYLTTHYETARKYAKGNRRMYLITVAKGIDLIDGILNVNKAIAFINNFVQPSKRKEILYSIEKYRNDDTIKAYIFNNLLINHDAIKPSSTKGLRDFFIDNNIDYEIVFSPFGWGEDMMVLFNMNKIVDTKVIKPTDKIKDYLIKN